MTQGGAAPLAGQQYKSVRSAETLSSLHAYDAEATDVYPTTPWYRQTRYRLMALLALLLVLGVAVGCAVLIPKAVSSGNVQASTGNGNYTTTSSTVTANTSAPTEATSVSSTSTIDTTPPPTSTTQTSSTSANSTTAVSATVVPSPVCDPANANVVINEIFPNKPQDWVEFHNLDPNCEAHLTGWAMRDSNASHVAMAFRNACQKIPAGGYMVVFSGVGDCAFDFGLASGKGDSVNLMKNGQVVQTVTWADNTVPGVSSYARNADGSFSATTSVTMGKANPATVFAPPTPAPKPTQPPSGDYERSYSIYDSSLAYTGPLTWGGVDTIEIKTWDTPTYSFSQMYNAPRVAGNSTPNVAVDACIRSSDYATDLQSPCGRIWVRGATAREAPVKSFSIQINKDAPLGKWRGTRQLILSRSPFDYSRLRHALGYRLLRSIPNMVSLNVNFVNVKMNGEDWGLYTFLEDYDDGMLERHGLDKNGFLLKAKNFGFSLPDSGWPGSADWLEAETRTDSAEWYDRILPVAKGLDEAAWANDGAAFKKVFTENFNLENVITYLAFAAVILNNDIFNQNYYLYSPSDARKWSFLFWDLDGGFDWCGQEGVDLNDPACKAHNSGLLAQMRTDDGYVNHVYRQLLSVDGMLDRVTARARELTQPGGPLAPDFCVSVLNQMASTIRPYVSVGPKDTWPMDVDQFDREIERLRNFLSNMMSNYESRELGGWSNANISPLYEHW